MCTIGSMELTWPNANLSLQQLCFFPLYPDPFAYSQVMEESCSVSGFITEQVGANFQLQAYKMQESGIFSYGQENSVSRH